MRSDNMDHTGFTLQAQHICFHVVSVHQTAPPVTSNSSHLIAAYYSFIDPKRWKAELAYTAGQVQVRESHHQFIITQCQTQVFTIWGKVGAWSLLSRSRSKGVWPILRSHLRYFNLSMQQSTNCAVWFFRLIVSPQYLGVEISLVKNPRFTV